MATVTVWNENYHEQHDEHIAKLYPQGIHGAIGAFLGEDKHTLQYATLDMPAHGLTQEVLDNTDVLVWWGHVKHAEVQDEVVERIHRRVLDGMGLIVLHSGHYSKIFKKLMGTSCSLKWRVIGEHERIWRVSGSHPITANLPDSFVLPQSEMYGERFDIPEPDELVFISWYPGGEVFRSGCCFHRGAGKIFYFGAGHETYPIFYQKEVQQVLKNAVNWATPVPVAKPVVEFHNPLEAIMVDGVAYGPKE